MQSSIKKIGSQGPEIGVTASRECHEPKNTIIRRLEGRFQGPRIPSHFFPELPKSGMELQIPLPKLTGLAITDCFAERWIEKISKKSKSLTYNFRLLLAAMSAQENLLPKSKIKPQDIHLFRLLKSICFCFRRAPVPSLNSVGRNFLTSHSRRTRGVKSSWRARHIRLVKTLWNCNCNLFRVLFTWK